MIIGILKEKACFETRVAVTPQTVERLKKMGFDIEIEQFAGLSSGISDDSYKEAGANIKANFVDILQRADILLCVQPSLQDMIQYMKSGCMLIGDFQNLFAMDMLKLFKEKKITCLALDKLPRISRAQPFDILSSQNNLSGYQAVLCAVNFSRSIVPMMITSAGVVAPMKFLIVGVGVAGLQAIATAKRLGAKVYAYDIREEVREQVKSLNAIFVSSIDDVLQDMDVIITSAFVAGRRAPLLIKNKMIKLLKQSVVIIDMAAGFGGNVEGVCNFKVVKVYDRLIYGNSNLAAKIPATASMLLANNFANFLEYMKDIEMDFNDELVKETCIVKG